jgi:hypothetical protein
MTSNNEQQTNPQEPTPLSGSKKRPVRKASPNRGRSPHAGRKSHKPSKKRAPLPLRAGSKTVKVLTLLQRPGGVSMKELMKATGWQTHSVRGFLSGTVGKKMQLPLTSTKDAGGERRYVVAKTHHAGRRGPGSETQGL